MTRKHGAGESYVNRMAAEQLCAETFQKFTTRRSFQPAPARDNIKPGGLVFTALDVMRENDAPGDYEAENAKTKAKFFKRRFGKKK